MHRDVTFLALRNIWRIGGSDGAAPIGSGKTRIHISVVSDGRDSLAI